jgi:hypothetical protein
VSARDGDLPLLSYLAFFLVFAGIFAVMALG